MDTATIISLRVNHLTLTLKQLLQRLRINASWADIGRCKDDLTIECWACALGLTADIAGLQAEVTRFRRANKLVTASQTREWLECRKMTLDDLIDLLRPQALREILARHVVSADEIRQHFLEFAHEFDRAEISTITTEEYGAAQELLFRVEEGSDFHMLARAYSSDAATAKSGGYVGLISRSDLGPETAAAVFHATQGTVLGPFERKREYSLILVENLYPAELTEAVEENIREQIFRYKLEAYQRTLDIHEDIWSLGEG